MNDVIQLIRITQTIDAYGDPLMKETARQVFCRVASVGAKEFYQAAAIGLQPEIKFVLADYLDYEGEKLVEYNGCTYHVLRTYRDGRELELTCYSEVNPA